MVVMELAAGSWRWSQRSRLEKAAWPSLRKWIAARVGVERMLWEQIREVWGGAGAEVRQSLKQKLSLIA